MECAALAFPALFCWAAKLDHPIQGRHADTKLSRGRVPAAVVFNGAKGREFAQQGVVNRGFIGADVPKLRRVEGMIGVMPHGTGPPAAL